MPIRGLASRPQASQVASRAIVLTFRLTLATTFCYFSKVPTLRAADVSRSFAATPANLMFS